MSVPSGSDREAIGCQASIGTATGRTNRLRESMYEIVRKTAAEKTSRLKKNIKIPGDNG
jgi:hypothetical protein